MDDAECPGSPGGVVGNLTPEFTSQAIITNMNENPPRPLPAEEKQKDGLEDLDQSDPSPERSSEMESINAYQSNRTAAEAKLEASLKEETSRGKLSQVRESLGLNSDQDLTQESFDIDALEAEVIRSQANYPGHWTLVLQERLGDPAIKQKFFDTRLEALSSLKEGTVGLYDKPKKFRSHYESQIENYDKNIDSIFSHTQIGNAAEYGKKPTNAGMGNIGEPGVVFSDGESRESGPLTVRQKMIIEAHEKGHGMRDFQGSDATEIQSVLDLDVLRELQNVAVTEDPQNRFANYLQKPEEITERMAQLKNYFGFKGNETFTQKHLDYAREHYIADTGLDNNMTPFFAAITPETEAKFIEVMNKYPI